MDASQMKKAGLDLEAVKGALPEYQAEADDYNRSLLQKGENSGAPAPVSPSWTASREGWKPDPSHEQPTEAYPEFIIIQRKPHDATVMVAECQSVDGVRPVVYEIVADNMQRERAADFVRSLDLH